MTRTACPTASCRFGSRRPSRPGADRDRRGQDAQRRGAVQAPARAGRPAQARPREGEGRERPTRDPGEGVARPVRRTGAVLRAGSRRGGARLRDRDAARRLPLALSALARHYQPNARIAGSSCRARRLSSITAPPSTRIAPWRPLWRRRGSGCATASRASTRTSATSPATSTMPSSGSRGIRSVSPATRSDPSLPLQARRALLQPVDRAVSLETIEPIADIETEASARIGCTATEHVSLAYHENAIPVIREIVVTNPSDRDLVDLLIRVESRPAVVQPLTLRIDRIPAGANHHIEAPDLRLDAALLAGFTEASRLELTTILEEAGSALARDVAEIRLLPPSHWGGGVSAPELLAAFVRPNDPAVDVVLRDAATKLGEAGRETGLNGYTTGRKARAWELAPRRSGRRSPTGASPTSCRRRASSGPARRCAVRARCWSGGSAPASISRSSTPRLPGTGRAQPGPGADGGPRLRRPVAAGRGFLLGRRRRQATPAQAPRPSGPDPRRDDAPDPHPAGGISGGDGPGGGQVEDDAPAALEVAIDVRRAAGAASARWISGRGGRAASPPRRPRLRSTSRSLRRPRSATTRSGRPSTRPRRPRSVAWSAGSASSSTSRCATSSSTSSRGRGRSPSNASPPEPWRTGWRRGTSSG